LPEAQEGSVTNRSAREDGSIDDLPWAAVFDPAANARALSAIQAEGFRAASRIVDRFVRAVGTDGNTATVPTADTGATDSRAVGDTGPNGLQEFERLTRAWWSLVGQGLLRSMPTAAPAGSDVVSLDVSDPKSTGAVTLHATVGGRADAEVWLHNRGPDDRGKVALRSSDLLSHEGDVIFADAVQMDSAVVAMPRRSSRGVAITVNLAPDVRPGVYRGTLLGSGHPDLWLPIVLTVRMPET
jgi:hypothetical protein